MVGLIPESIGCIVVDLDEGDLDKFIGTYGEPNCAHRTYGSHGGYHLWYHFDYNTYGSVSNKTFRLDGFLGQFRGSNGYVILWSPETLEHSLPNQSVGHPSNELLKLMKSSSNNTETIKQPSIDDIKYAIPGERNDTLNRVVYHLSQSDITHDKLYKQVHDIVKKECWFEQGFTEGEFNTTFRSAWASGSQFRVQDIDEEPPKLPIQSILATLDYPQLKPIFWYRDDPALMHGTLGILAGAGAVGKSRALLQLGIARVLGRHWMDALYIEKGYCVLVSAEDQPGVIGQRMKQILAILELTNEQKDIIQDRFYIIDKPYLDLIEYPAENENQSLIALRNTLIDMPNSLVLIDTLNRVNNAQEDNASWRHVTRRLESICNDGHTVIATHHVSQSARQSYATDVSAVRGGTGLVDNCRAVWLLSKLDPNNDNYEPNHVILNHAKSNYCKSHPKLLIDNKYSQPVKMVREL